MFERHALLRGEVVRYRTGRVVLGKALHIANCYRLGPLMVDAGAPNQAPQLRAALRAGPPRAVLVTHGHEDHAGSAGVLGAGEVLGPAGVQVARGVPFYRRVAWGEPPTVPDVAPVPGEVEAGGFRLRPFPTPGHTPDHLAYWEPDRGWLFTGDAALGPVRYAMRGEDTLAYLASLRRMRDLKPEVVLPAHGPVLDRPAEQLGAQVRRLEELRDAARRLAREGLGERAITRRLLGLEGFMARISGGEFGKVLLVRGLLREGP